MRSNDGSLRGPVYRFTNLDSLPKQSKANDKKMRKQHDNLYGLTRMTDEQLGYFYVKCEGCAAAIKRELSFMSVQAIHNRLNDLGLPIMGNAGVGIDKDTKVEVFNKLTNKSYSYTKLAKKFSMPVSKVKTICAGLGFVKYDTFGMTNEVFCTIYKNCCEGTKAKKVAWMSQLLKKGDTAVYRKCRELGL